MTPHIKPANQPGQPDRLVIELDVATIKRLCHLLGANTVFNDCFKDILYMTKVCENAEEQYAAKQRDKVVAEAKADGAREFQTKQEALKVQLAQAEKLRLEKADPVADAEPIELKPKGSTK